MMLLAMLCFLGGARAQSELTVYDGTTTNDYVPVYGWYADAYLKSQFVIPAEELSVMKDGTISAMKFYATQSEVSLDGTFQVLLMEIDETSLSAYVDTGNATLVYEGILGIANNEMAIEFSTNYSYKGGNLLISVYQTAVSTSYPTSTFYGQNVSDACVQGYSYSSLDAVSANQRNFIPKTTFTYTSGSGPTCVKPETLEASDITGYGATLTWESEVGNYTFEYKKASATEWTVVRGLTTNTYELSNLDTFTKYDARVKAVCEVGLESGYKTTSFTTLDVCPDGKVCIGEGTSTNDYLPTYTYYNNSLTQQIYTADEIGIGSAVAITSVDFYCKSTTTRSFDIYMVSTEKDSFIDGSDWVAVTASDLVYSGNVRFMANTWTTIEFENPFIFDGVNNVVLVIDDNTGSYVSGPSFLAFETTNQAICSYNDNTDYDPTNPSSYTGTLVNVKNRVRLGMGEPPSCPKPTGLTVNYTGGTTATVSWTSDAAAWQLGLIGADGQTIEHIYGVTTNPYTLENLALGTTYRLAIRSVCGEGIYSEWANLTNPVTFTTDLCAEEDKCVISYELSDGYGDGWNGAAINVVDVETDKVLATWTLTSGSSGSGILAVCPERVIRFEWVVGSYDSECSYVVKDVNDIAIFSGSDAMSNVNYTVDCTEHPYRTPTNLTASEIQGRSAVISWTDNSLEPATNWTIAYYGEGDEDITYVTTPDNPYTLTGLTPETEYYVWVSPVIGDDRYVWSDYLTFTTTSTNPAPTDLAVSNITPTTATATWQSFADSYEVRYAQLPDTGLGEGWLIYDNNTHYTNIGSGTAGERTWGVMYPGSMSTGNKLTKVAYYEYKTYYDTATNITVNIYSGGDDAPTTLLYTKENITPLGESGFHEITFDSPIAITPGENLWITLTVTGTYVMAACQVNSFNNQWWVRDGKWSNMGNDNSNLAGFGWMIRGYFESETTEINWTTATTTEKSYDITGLDPETKYVVQVQGDFGSDGTSEWATTTFTTLSTCDAPNELAATDISTDGATLSWTGYQESYNLKYRASVAQDLSTPATIILTAGDVWSDGSGYQMLLDADHTAYGTTIPTSGPLTQSGDASEETYAEFEYKIPANADGALDTENIVFDNSVTIQIPAGTYDWCITNPSSGAKMWIAGAGDVPGRYDNFVFEPGVTYEFTMQKFGTGDGAALTITRPMGDWTTVENVTTPYELTDLTSDTEYEWQVQGNCTEGQTEWSEIASFWTYEQTSIKFAAEGYATYYNGQRDVVLPEGMKAYVVTASDASLTYAPIADGDDTEDNLVPARTAMLLEVEPAGANQISIYLARPSAAAYTGTNFLFGSDEETETTGGEKFYKLTYSNNNDNFGWYWGATNGAAFTSPAHKAWLALPASTPAPFFGLPDDSNTTGIIGIDNGQLTIDNGEWYTLQGMKVGKKPTTAGVYIHNGKKFVIK